MNGGGKGNEGTRIAWLAAKIVSLNTRSNSISIRCGPDFDKLPQHSIFLFTICHQHAEQLSPFTFIAVAAASRHNTKIGDIYN